MPDDSPDPDVGRVDVTGLSLTELRVSSDRVLANAIRRAVQEAERSAEAVSGFGSAI